MKIVRKDVCHVWAHQTQETARWGHISFAGPTIYSYAAPIARHVKAKDGGQVVLFTLQGYSSTTAGHKNEIRRAIPPNVDVFEVLHPEQKPSVKDVKGYTARIANQSLVVTRSKSRMQSELDELHWLVDEANGFCETFGFKTRFVMPADIEEMKAIAVGHEAARIRKEKSQSAKRRRDEVKRLKGIQERMDAWLAGHEVQPPHMPDGFSRMRIVGNEVQTSSRAIVPVKHVKRVAKLVVKMRDRTGTRGPMDGAHRFQSSM